MGKWKKTSDPGIERYLGPYEDMCIIVIRTCSVNKYILVFDDAHDEITGNSEVLTKEEIKTKYGISLQI